MTNANKKRSSHTTHERKVSNTKNANKSNKIVLFSEMKRRNETKRLNWNIHGKKNRAELLFQYRFFYSIFLRFGSFPRFRLSSCLISIYGDGSGYVCVHVHSSNLNIRFDQIIIPISILFPFHLWWTFYVLKEKIEKKTRDTEIETERDWKAKAS